jgi:hypothetical protein
LNREGGAASGAGDEDAAGAGIAATLGSFRTSSRDIRHAAWMIQEIERSWRIASRCVSSSIAALKYSVTFFFGDGTGELLPVSPADDYCEIAAADGRKNITFAVTM